jgi:predicted DNA-binding transcriptional regulator AlpA
MAEQLLNRKEAAQYTGLRTKYFDYQIEMGNGPAFVRPSPKRIFFYKRDLDAWVASWQHSDTSKA